MINYEIITAGTPMYLEYEVNRKLDDGWLLIGGVCAVTNEDGSSDWAQAMTKREPIPYEYEKHPVKEKGE